MFTQEIFFGMDRCFEESYIQGAEFRFLPAFEEKILEEDANTQIVIDVTGTKLKRFKQKQGVSIPHFLEFPVKNRKDFNEIIKRLNPESPARYPRNWEDYKNP